MAKMLNKNNPTLKENQRIFIFYFDPGAPISIEISFRFFFHWRKRILFIRTHVVRGCCFVNDFIVKSESFFISGKYSKHFPTPLFADKIVSSKSYRWMSKCFWAIFKNRIWIWVRQSIVGTDRAFAKQPYYLTPFAKIRKQNKTNQTTAWVALFPTQKLMRFYFQPAFREA